MRYLVGALPAEFETMTEAEQFAANLAKQHGTAFVLVVEDGWHNDGMLYENVGVMAHAMTEKRAIALMNGEDE